MIIDNSGKLSDKIKKALSKVTNEDAWVNMDPDTGTPKGKEDLYPFDADDMNNKYKKIGNNVDVRISDFSGKGVPERPIFEEEYKNDNFTGTEVMVDVISKEILNYVIDNAEVALKSRFDKLESDYNIMLAAMKSISDTLTFNTKTVTEYNTSNTISVVDADELKTVLSDVFSTIETSGGGYDRQSKITQKYIKEHEVVNRDGTYYDVQIK